MPSLQQHLHTVKGHHQGSSSTTGYSLAQRATAHTANLDSPIILSLSLSMSMSERSPKPTERKDSILWGGIRQENNTMRLITATHNNNSINPICKKLSEHAVKEVTRAIKDKLFQFENWENYKNLTWGKYNGKNDKFNHTSNRRGAPPHLSFHSTCFLTTDWGKTTHFLPYKSASSWKCKVASKKEQNSKKINK